MPTQDAVKARRQRTGQAGDRPRLATEAFGAVSGKGNTAQVAAERFQRPRVKAARRPLPAAKDTTQDASEGNEKVPPFPGHRAAAYHGIRAISQP
jgi:hypothetical protein